VAWQGVLVAVVIGVVEAAVVHAAHGAGPWRLRGACPGRH
jgi:hypothetical protein